MSSAYGANRTTLAIVAAGIATALALLLPATPAHAVKRVALVIGNDAYENVPALQKAVNDAHAMGEELTKLGFDVVSAQDVGRRAMSRALVELENKVVSGDTVLIYFAGHGFAVEDTNYLLPVDVPAAGPGEEGLVRDASFAASGLSDRLQEKGAATVILILDACRDNPFALKGKRSIGLTRGLTRMDPAEGMFVLFSAGQGQSALDRLGDADTNPNSVFTRTLLQEMDQPGQSMVQIAKRTQSKVRELAAKVDHVQVRPITTRSLATFILRRRVRQRPRVPSTRWKKVVGRAYCHSLSRSSRRCPQARSRWQASRGPTAAGW
ncbi:MAG: caspase family protein [Methyloceanibacter sp.]